MTSMPVTTHRITNIALLLCPACRSAFATQYEYMLHRRICPPSLARSKIYTVKIPMTRHCDLSDMAKPDWINKLDQATNDIAYIVCPSCSVRISGIDVRKHFMRHTLCQNVQEYYPVHLDIPSILLRYFAWASNLWKYSISKADERAILLLNSKCISPPSRSINSTSTPVTVANSSTHVNDNTHTSCAATNMHIPNNTMAAGQPKANPAQPHRPTISSNIPSTTTTASTQSHTTSTTQIRHANGPTHQVALDDMTAQPSHPVAANCQPMDIRTPQNAMNGDSQVAADTNIPYTGFSHPQHPYAVPVQETISHTDYSNAAASSRRHEPYDLGQRPLGGTDPRTMGTCSSLTQPNTMQDAPIHMRTISFCPSIQPFPPHSSQCSLWRCPDPLGAMGPAPGYNIHYHAPTNDVTNALLSNHHPPHHDTSRSHQVQQGAGHMRTGRNMDSAHSSSSGAINLQEVIQSIIHNQKT